LKIHEAAQGTQAWLEARAGIPTASEFDALITPLWKIRTGEGVTSYVARKLAEKWAGPLPSFGGSGAMSWAMEQGQILETEVIPWYEYETGHAIQRVGFITTDDDKAGCSPDGLIGEDGGIEIKAPQSPKHVEYILAGKLPPEYAAQVHGSMYVTGRAWWKFVSYRRHFPPLILTIERDEDVQELIGKALAAFHQRFEYGWGELIALNEGPPPKREPMTFAHEFRSEMPT